VIHVVLGVQEVLEVQGVLVLEVRC